MRAHQSTAASIATTRSGSHNPAGSVRNGAGIRTEYESGGISNDQIASNSTLIARRDGRTGLTALMKPADSTQASQPSGSHPTLPGDASGPFGPGGLGGQVAAAMRRGGEGGLPALHLLIVDDDAAVRNACAEIARRMGFVVVTAADRDAARAILKHHQVDMMLLDLRLAGVNGLELLEEVKALNPDTSVIVMTAFATVASAVEAMRIGAGDYLTKPFALHELVTVLDRACERTHFDLESRRLRERLRSNRRHKPNSRSDSDCGANNEERQTREMAHKRQASQQAKPPHQGCTYYSSRAVFPFGVIAPPHPHRFAIGHGSAGLAWDFSPTNQPTDPNGF